MTLRNPGDCALHLTWSRLDKEWGDIGATGGSAAGVEQGFLCQPLRAVLLPGESVTTTFTHQHDHEGIYSEQWRGVFCAADGPAASAATHSNALGRQQGAVPRSRASKEQAAHAVRASLSLIVEQCAADAADIAEANTVERIRERTRTANEFEARNAYGLRYTPSRSTALADFAKRVLALQDATTPSRRTGTGRWRRWPCVTRCRRRRHR